MIKKLNVDIPAKSLGYLLVCVGIIVILVLGLLSFHRYNSGRSQDVKKIQDRIDEQKDLGQMYRLLKSAKEEKNVYGLHNPPAAQLARQNVDLFQDAFRAEVGQAGLMTVSLLPDFKSISGGSRHLLYDATLRGEFINFRKLLAGLGKIPYIDRIEEIDIRQHGDSMEFNMKIRIALAH